MRRSFRTLRRRLCYPRGSTPGWYAVPRWGTAKAVLPTSLPHTARADASTVGFLSQVSRKTKTRSRRAHPKPGQQRDEAGASIGGDHPIPSRTARNPILPRASLRAQDSSRGPPPATRPPAPARHPTIPRAAAGSGRSEPWRRTASSISRTARKLILPRASSASEGLIPRSYRECPLPFPAGAAG